MKSLLRAVARILAFFAAVWAFGKVAELFLPKRDYPEDDDFEFAVIGGGKEYASEAPALRAGWALTAMGGLDVDLRGATIAPDGADLRFVTWMGGLRVLVPETWNVEVEGSVTAGNNEIDVADPTSLASDAPNVRIHLSTTMGGVLVTTDPDAEATVAVQA